MISCKNKEEHFLRSVWIYYPKFRLEGRETSITMAGSRPQNRTSDLSKKSRIANDSFVTLS